MADDTARLALLAALAIALLIAAFTDLHSRRIGNRLNGAIALGAPVFWWASGMVLWPNVASQLAIDQSTESATSQDGKTVVRDFRTSRSKSRRKMAEKIAVAERVGGRHSTISPIASI